MAIDKALYGAPMGLDALTDAEPAVEIEIVDPEELNISADGVEISLSKQAPRADDFDANLADYIDENELGSIAGELLGQYEQDLASRKDWLDTYKIGRAHV